MSGVSRTCVTKTEEVRVNSLVTKLDSKIMMVAGYNNYVTLCYCRRLPRTLLLQRRAGRHSAFLSRSFYRTVHGRMHHWGLWQDVSSFHR